jgi:molybdopterin-guanine dinucleotide biosynthesis protein A
MGQPKMSLKLGDRSVLAHTTQALLASCREVLVIAAPAGTPDGVEEALAELPSTPSLRVLHDAQAHRGPLPGIVTGLAEAGNAITFVAAGDAPFLAPVLIGGLIDALGAEPQTDAMVPRVDSCAQPLTAAYRTAPMLSCFRQALDDGESSPRRSLRRATFQEIAAEDLRRWDPALNSFLNINDAADFARAQALELQLKAGDVG